MKNDHQSSESSEVLDISVTSREDVSYSLEKGDYNSKEFLKGVQHIFFFFVLLVYSNDFSSNDKLNDHRSSYDWSDSELHKGSSVGSHNKSGPEHRIVTYNVRNSEKWDL